MFKALMAFALIAGSAVAPVLVAPADAQRREVVRERTVVRTVTNRGYRDRRVYRGNRGYRGWSTRRVCDRQWRGGRRVGGCSMRTVRRSRQSPRTSAIR